MGYYINPKGMTKEEWLQENHRGFSLIPPKAFRRDGAEGPELVVCLVDNGGFTAAGVVYCQTELEAFAQPDPRPKLWFWVPKAKVLEEVPELASGEAPDAD